MKKVIMLSAIMGALVSANALANPATVNFNGNVTATSCTVVAASESVDLVLPDVSTKQIADVANYGILGESPESAIQLVSCPASVTSVDVASSVSTGAPYEGSTNSVLPETGAGEGIYVIAKAKTSSGNFVNLSSTGDATGLGYVPSGTGDVSIPVKASVYKDGSVTPVPGDYSTTYTMTFSWS